MKKYAALLLTLILVGCGTATPVMQKFPESSDTLKTACPKLKTIDKDTVVISEFTRTVTENYKTYHSCAAQVDAWIEWYETQKKIFEDAQKANTTK